MYVSGVGIHVPVPVHVEIVSVLGKNPVLQWTVIVAPSRVLLIFPTVPLMGGSGDSQSTSYGKK